MKKILLITAAIWLVPSYAFAVDCSGYNSTNCHKQGGNSWVVGGTQTVITGGTLTADSGSTVTLAGTNTISGATSVTGAITQTSNFTRTFSPTANSATTNKGFALNLTAPVDTTGTNTHTGLDVAFTVGNATGGTNTVNGINFPNYTGDAQVNVNAIKIGTSDGLGTANAITVGSGWDLGIVTDSSLKVNSTNGTAISAVRFAQDAVASGQTAKTTTLTGVTTASLCVATGNEVPSNAAYIKSAAAGTDQVVVTVNTDPGASNLDFTVICLN